MSGPVLVPVLINVIGRRQRLMMSAAGAANLRASRKRFNARKHRLRDRANKLLFDSRHDDGVRDQAAEAIIEYAFAVDYLLNSDVPDAAGGDERLAADELVDAALRAALGRVRDCRERDVRAFGNILQKSELTADVIDLVDVDPAHVCGDRIDCNQADVADPQNVSLKLVNVFAKQEHALRSALLAHPSHEMNSVQHRAGGGQPWKDFLIDGVVGRDHDDVGRRRPVGAVRAVVASRSPSDEIRSSLAICRSGNPGKQLLRATQEMAWP